MDNNTRYLILGCITIVVIVLVGLSYIQGMQGVPTETPENESAAVNNSTAASNLTATVTPAPTAEQTNATTPGA
ncbi:hypothetical protein [Methanocella arvoryzae]|uniref:Uncharacterized protein n=1 Tax=Methanocella arvoryzae (strain DSM 22066 / NBRC 105507 / MRE50) TaxID=351160 RepID=Q0W3W0_METAR|nr:hypothetical protein [Methanocella arvoryzae]CAJ36933.1 hypothetical protein RCIX1714 [Methanocella arvoryzae MRE50]